MTVWVSQEETCFWWFSCLFWASAPSEARVQWNHQSGTFDSYEAKIIWKIKLSGDLSGGREQWPAGEALSAGKALSVLTGQAAGRGERQAEQMGFRSKVLICY